MGEAKHRKLKFEMSSAPCIFCGGGVQATTEEHCPPRSLFRDRQWPEGFAFAACKACNSGSSDEDLLIAFLAHMGPGHDEKRQAKGVGLMKLVNRQQPDLLAQMMEFSAVEARSAARRLKMKPESGQTYQELGIAKVPDDMHAAVGRFALKLTKAIYYKHTDRVFPANGAVMFQWFTNAQMQEHGRIPVLDAFSNLRYDTSPITRSGKDLKDQFDYKFSTAPDEPLHVAQVIFGHVFGFVSVLSEEPGRLEDFQKRLEEKTGAKGPFEFVATSGGRKDTGRDLAPGFP